jgi:hypothetical protein
MRTLIYVKLMIIGDIVIKIIEDESDRGRCSDLVRSVNTAADAAYLLAAALRFPR